MMSVFIWNLCKISHCFNLLQTPGQFTEDINRLQHKGTGHYMNSMKYVPLLCYTLLWVGFPPLPNMGHSLQFYCKYIISFYSIYFLVMQSSFYHSYCKTNYLLEIIYYSLSMTIINIWSQTSYSLISASLISNKSTKV